MWGLQKLYLLMEKQHNRGQDGAGVATIKLDPEPGTRFISRHRSNDSKAVSEIFQHIYGHLPTDPNQLKDVDYLKKNTPFYGELLLGHLRYGTHGTNSLDKCHPFIRENNWMSKTLVLAGNFNLTNVDELIQVLMEMGQHPVELADTVTVLEKIGHFLDLENQLLFDAFKSKGFSNKEITSMIASELSLTRVLKAATKKFDGGYAMAGMVGHGDSFVLRDPNGIRPAFYYANDEVVVVASERPAIMTAFNVRLTDVKEITPGAALIVKKDGQMDEVQILPQGKKTPCSFERIYFSRGNDASIYKERKKLGYLLSPLVAKAINDDFENTVFSYIPNTAATSFYGMIDGMLDRLNELKAQKILALGNQVTLEELTRILNVKPRREKIAVKDAKLRTFIADDSQRGDMVAHVYDVTYGLIKNQQDTLVVIDDSIVRGTTLKQSILRILDRLHPKKIIIVSSAPLIKYPDCYGIDMSRLGEFVAFQALIQLLKKSGKESLLQETYERCKKALMLPASDMENEVKKLYDLFSDEAIVNEVAQIVTHPELDAEVQLIFQTIPNLHEACPEHTGDWYFSGNYPTPGGNRVVNKAFINFMEGNSTRAY